MTRQMLIALFAGIGALSVTACENDSEIEEAAEDVADDVEDAADDAADEFEDAADDVDDN